MTQSINQLFQYDYFTLFSLDQRYALDHKALKQNYRQLLVQFHPDRFADASAQERRLAVQLTGYINTAYDTLNSPVERARYLLKLQGVETDLEYQTINDVDFLTMQMTWREKIENSQNNQQALQDLEQELNEQFNQLQQHLTTLFDETDQPDTQQLKKYMIQLKYFDKLLKEIHLTTQHT